MSTPVDRPSAAELEQLSSLLAADPLDRPALVTALSRLIQGLKQHSRDVSEAGGLLDEQDQAARMSLAREDTRLQEEGSALLNDLKAFRRDVDSETDDELTRGRGQELLAGLRGHRNAEASLVLESADTEVGAGD